MDEARSRGWTVAVIVLVLLVGASCFGKANKTSKGASPAAAVPSQAPTPTPTPSPTPTPTPQDILKQAADRWNQLDTLHFSLQIDGTVALDQQGLLLLHSADGDLKRPGLAQATAKITVGGANVGMKMIAIGSDEYITNFLNGKWEKAPPDLGYNPAVLFDPNQGLGSVLTSVQNPTVVGSESINGQDTQHIKGTVSRQSVDPITGGALKSDTVDVDVWEARSSHDVLKIVLHDPGSNGAPPATWMLTTSNQNQPVTIERPNV